MNDLKPLFYKAKKYFIAGHFDEAMDLYKTVISKEIHSSETDRMFALCCAALILENKSAYIEAAYMYRDLYSSASEEFSSQFSTQYEYARDALRFKPELN